MKLFIRNFLFFLVPIFIAIICFEFYLRNIDTVYKEKVKGLLDNAKSIEVLILGNSHANNGISPSEFDFNTFNIAQSNQSIYFDKRITLKYLDSLPRLKYVIISVDFHSLYFSSQGERDSWSYYAYGINYRSHLSFLPRFSYLIGYSPRVAFSFLKKHLFFGTPLDIPAELLENEIFARKNKGWIAYEGTEWNSMNDVGCEHRAASFNNTVQNISEKQQILSDLNDFIRILQNKGITPVLVTLPIFHGFSKYLNPSVKTQNKIDILNLIKENNVSYFDFADTSFQKKYFYNCDHLNKEGSYIISQVLNQKLKELDVRSQYKIN